MCRRRSEADALVDAGAVARACAPPLGPSLARLPSTLEASLSDRMHNFRGVFVSGLVLPARAWPPASVGSGSHPWSGRVDVYLQRRTALRL